MKEIIKFGLVLLFICVSASALLAGVYKLTSPRIEEQSQKEQAQAMQEVVPQAVRFEPVKKGELVLYYRGIDKDNMAIAVVFFAEGKGYSSSIRTAVGMTMDGRILGIEIVTQNETPGLGARITEVEDTSTAWDALKGKKSEEKPQPWFPQRFKDRKIEELDAVEAITGATISSRAVIDSVKNKAKEIKALLEDGKE
jgi:RnfABCDGE-type electron transport complex G subunit